MTSCSSHLEDVQEAGAEGGGEEVRAFLCGRIGANVLRMGVQRGGQPPVPGGIVESLSHSWTAHPLGSCYKKQALFLCMGRPTS